MPYVLLCGNGCTMIGLNLPTVWCRKPISMIKIWYLAGYTMQIPYSSCCLSSPDVLSQLFTEPSCRRDGIYILYMIMLCLCTQSLLWDRAWVCYLFVLLNVLPTSKLFLRNREFHYKDKMYLWISYIYNRKLLCWKYAVSPRILLIRQGEGWNVFLLSSLFQH